MPITKTARAEKPAKKTAVPRKEKIKKPKKAKKERPPQYYLSATNIRTLNYSVYYMGKVEKLGYFLLAFLVGAAVGYLFFSGIGKDAFGLPTTTTYVLDLAIPFVAGTVAGALFLPVRTQQIIAKRRRALGHQFRDLLDALATALGAGKNIPDSFLSVYMDLKLQYEEDAFIIQELGVIISGIQNNIPAEDLLADFGQRSNMEDIASFANVFRVSYRKGGNIRDVIRSTHTILSEKMEISEDIETLVTSTKTEQNVMMVMPVFLVAAMKGMSPEFAANFVTPTGIIATLVAVIMFIVAYFVGRTILDIKL